MSDHEEPEQVGVDVRFEPDDFGIEIRAVVGEASIVIQHSWDGAEDAATLVQALPGILMAVQEALDQQDAQEGS